MKREALRPCRVCGGEGVSMGFMGITPIIGCRKCSHVSDDKYWQGDSDHFDKVKNLYAEFEKVNRIFDKLILEHEKHVELAKLIPSMNFVELVKLLDSWE